jgi:RNA polymerase sigma-70 factor (sigma-E family)
MDRADQDLVTFCRTERTRLVGTLAWYTGSRQVAEELAQDALAKLCVHWPRVRAMDHPRAWLHRVAINLAKSWFRRQAAERRCLARHGPGQLESGEADRADVVAVRRAVASLPERQRTALVLRHYVGCSVAEVAATMGCAEGTVKSLTSRAITILRDQHDLVELERVPG